MGRARAPGADPPHMRPGSLSDGQRLLVVLLPCFGVGIRDDEDKKDDIDHEDGDEKNNADCQQGHRWLPVVCGGDKCEDHHDRGRDAAESRCHDPPSRMIDVVEAAHR